MCFWKKTDFHDLVFPSYCSINSNYQFGTLGSVPCVSMPKSGPGYALWPARSLVVQNIDDKFTETNLDGIDMHRIMIVFTLRFCKLIITITTASLTFILHMHETILYFDNSLNEILWVEIIQIILKLSMYKQYFSVPYLSIKCFCN